MTRYLFAFCKQLPLLVLLIACALAVNWPVVISNIIYPEQPLLYVANQSIHHFTDLLNIYFHPQLFDLVLIPFFRPTGHFLIYQCLAPFLGWQNNQGFVIVNLIFLGLTGYMLVKLYALLFSPLRYGGYIAFAVYLMHPALMLSRAMALHFEFAYTFFTLLCLYCFVRFVHFRRAQDKKNGLLALSLISFLIAITFKEGALILGPLMVVYLFIFISDTSSAKKLFFSVWQGFADKTLRQLILLITILTLAMTLYITLPWPGHVNPARNAVILSAKLAAANELIKLTLLVKFNLIHIGELTEPQYWWRAVTYLTACKIIIWTLFSMSCIVGSLLFYKKNTAEHHKKSLFFLLICILVSFILPINWGMGFGWHLNLSLLFLSLVLGFTCDYVLKRIISHQTILVVGYVSLLLFICINAYRSNAANIKVIIKNQNNQLVFNMLHNALVMAPPIKNQLNDESVIVIADDKIKNAYFFGGAIYPFRYGLPALSNQAYSDYIATHNIATIQHSPDFDGALFQWVYDRPHLRQEVVPFDVHFMQPLFVENEQIYDWLTLYPNIFCFTYDSQGRWHDETALFIKNLMIEKKERHLVVNTYDMQPATLLSGGLLKTYTLPYSDPEVCQYKCDKNKQCTGFTYFEQPTADHKIRRGCDLFSIVDLAQGRFCADCVSYTKQSNAHIFQSHVEG